MWLTPPERPWHGAARLACLAAIGSLWIPTHGHAQSDVPVVTIRELRDAQRAVLDADIRRQLSRAKGAPDAVAGAASASLGRPVPAIALASPTPAPAASAPAPHKPTQADEGPRVYVTGQAQRRGTWHAEVVTEQGAWLLPVGRVVPGTSWTIAAVEPGRVVLSGPVPRKGSPALKEFMLGGAARPARSLEASPS